MSTYNELPVYKATYDLLLEMFRFTKDFSKEYKYTVGAQSTSKNIIFSFSKYLVHQRPCATKLHAR